MPDFVPTHRITEEAAMRMLQAGLAKAREIGTCVSIAVVDAGGHLLAFVRMDGARRFSATASIKKAITSSAQFVPTASISMAKDVEISAQIRFGGDFTANPGGFPIIVEGQVIGGVGAGGGNAEQDVAVAKAALAAVGLEPFA